MIFLFSDWARCVGICFEVFTSEAVHRRRLLDQALAWQHGRDGRSRQPRSQPSNNASVNGQPSSNASDRS